MTDRNSAHPLIEINGRPLGDAFDHVLVSAVIDDHLYLPDMFTLRFHDLRRQLLDEAGFKVGVSLRISAPPTHRDTPELLISGEITALEAEFGAQGSYAVVRGYDHSHRMHRGRRTETYKQMTDADIARKIAARSNLLVGQIDATPGVHDLVSQANLTDLDFLKGRAREIGFELFVSEKKLNFRKPPESQAGPGTGDLQSRNPLQLAFGDMLESFRPRVTSAEQVSRVEVRGWDMHNKKEVVAHAAGKTTSATIGANPSELAAKFGESTFVSVNRALSSQAEVDAAARSLAEQVASAFTEADGVAKGDPKLKAGAAVAISLVGKPFEGQYVLTSTRHVFDDQGYRTQFVVSGRQDRSLLGVATLGATGGSSSAAGPPIYGVVIALVTNSKDPEDLGRVKLKFPWMSNDYETDWARVTQVGAGHNRGQVVIPEVNDEVLVAFEHGDIRAPFVVGSLYNGKDKPKMGEGLIDSGSGEITRRGFVSRKGHMQVFFDGDGKEGIALLTDDRGMKISLNKSKTTIRITSSGKVEIKGTTDVTIEAGTSLSLKAGTTATIEAGTSLELSAPEVKVSGDAMVTVSGGMIKLN